jgi:hypothetical protein
MTKNQIQEHPRMDRFPVSSCAPIFDASSEKAQIEHPAGTANKRIPFGQRPTCTVAEACDAAGLGRTKLYELIGGGQLDTLTIGRRRLVRIPSLLKLLEAEGG